MAATVEKKRGRLVAALTKMPSHMRMRLRELKAEGNSLRKRPDLLWYLLLQSAATLGNSRGWAGLCGNPETLNSVGYHKLASLSRPKREQFLLAILQKAKVRMPARKAGWLARNVTLIAEMGGVEKVTQLMLRLPNRSDKYRFILQFHGIGKKYGRNVWMDIYDQSFRKTIAVDERLKKVARALGFPGTDYHEVEAFYCAIADDANLEPWELDRTLYNFTDHFLSAIAVRCGQSRKSCGAV